MVMAHSTQEHRWLQVLPVELLVDILSLLDCTALLVCKQVCRPFNNLICCTASLQLIIELYAAGQEKGCSILETSPADKLDILKKHERAWDELRWSKEERVPMLAGDLWELCGGVLAQSHDSGISFRRLPSIYRSIEAAEWSIDDISHPFRDFGMDPAQDLLVLVESPRWSGSNPDHSYHFHVRTMSTGGPHPKAPSPPVISYLQAVRDAHVSYAIQISAQHLGIFFNYHGNQENELAVWEWTSGTIETALIGSEIQSFAFLTGRHIIMALLAASELHPDLEPRLMVLDFKTESKERHHVEAAEHVCSFCFPQLGSSANPLKLEIRSDPSPSWTPNSELNVPFYVAENNRLYVITLWLGVHNLLHFVTLLAPLTTFLSCMDGSLSHRIDNVFQWSDWGPRGSRMLMNRIPPSAVWVCYVYGLKYVALRKDQTRKNFVVDVYDFNQPSLRRFLHKNRHTNPETYVVDPSIFREADIFEDAIETSLPYRLRTLPLDLRSIAHVAIVCSEDSLIIVDSHVDRRQYRIMTF